VDAYIVRDTTVWATGDNCTSGDCIQLFDKDNNPVASYEKPNFRVVKPGDSLLFHNGYQFRIALTDQEANEVIDTLNAVAEDVRQFSGGTLKLDIAIHNTQVPITFSYDPAGFWVGNVDALDMILATRQKNPDLSLVVTGVRDPDGIGVHFRKASCVMTYDASNGIAGGAYAWVPKTSPPDGDECFTRDIVGNLVLAHVKAALQLFSGFENLYPTAADYPACGTGSTNKHAWFPGLDDCSRDPDYASCGTSCGSFSAFAEHVYGTHWDPNRALIMSKCKNGIKDPSESKIDSGGTCLVK
jgi:hypothetical protein